MLSISRCPRDRPAARRASALTAAGVPVGDDGAAVQDRDLVGEAEHDLHVVLDEQRGHARALQEPRQRVDGLGRLLDREALRRLVEQKHLGVLRHGHGDLEEPLVAVAEEAGRAARDIARDRAARGRHRRHFAPRAKTLSPPNGSQRRGLRACAASVDILAGRHLGKERGQLKRSRQSPLADGVRGQSRYVLAGKAHAARGRLHDAGDEMEQRGLAGAVGSDDGANLAARRPACRRCRRR